MPFLKVLRGPIGCPSQSTSSDTKYKSLGVRWDLSFPALSHPVRVEQPAGQTEKEQDNEHRIEPNIEQLSLLYEHYYRPDNEDQYAYGDQEVGNTPQIAVGQGDLLIFDHENRGLIFVILFKDIAERPWPSSFNIRTPQG